MSKTTPTLLVVLFCVAAILPAVAEATRTINGVFDYDKSRQVMTYINRLRYNKGQKPLKMDAALTEAAMLRAAELAFRKEEEKDGEIPYDYARRPSGDGNLKLIGEQRHVSQPKVDFHYLHLSHNLYTDIGSIVKSLKNNVGGEAAFFSTQMRSFGCGSYISSEGFHYWVLYLMPDNGTAGELPKGQNAVEVCISMKPGEQTKTLTRTTPDENLTPTSIKVTGRFNYSKAIEVVELTNKERAAKGLKPYIMDSTLMEMAMIRAAEMKALNKMTHTRPNGGSGPDILDEFFFDPAGEHFASGENIAFGQSSARQVMSQWMASPGHRDNIMNDYCNRMGAGECDGYWVQLFVNSKKKSRVLSKSARHTDEVTVVVTLVEGGESKVVKRKRGVK